MVATTDRITVRATVTDTRGARSRDHPLLRAAARRQLGSCGTTTSERRRSSRAASELANLGRLRGLGATGQSSQVPVGGGEWPGGRHRDRRPPRQPRVMRLVHNPGTGQLLRRVRPGPVADTVRVPAPGVGRPRRSTAFDPRLGLPSRRAGVLRPLPRAASHAACRPRGGHLGGLLRPVADPRHRRLRHRHPRAGRPVARWRSTTRPASCRSATSPSRGRTGCAIDDAIRRPRGLRSDHRLPARPRRRPATGGREATFSSGFLDDDGRYRAIDATVAPWCSGVGGCAVFTVNPDPDIHDPTYPLNKGASGVEATPIARRTPTMGLDGEYIDSYLGQRHGWTFGAPTSRPPTRRSPSAPPTSGSASPRSSPPPSLRAGSPDDVHEDLGKCTMANGMLLDVPWGADLFDFMGTETDWLRTGEFVPETTHG